MTARRRPILGKYVLNSAREPVLEPDIMRWGAWWENEDNVRVASDHVGDVFVSTVFLGLDHNYSDNGPPVLFETMTFAKGENPEDTRVDEWCRRYATWDEALRGHGEVVRAVRAAQSKQKPRGQ
jgi:hypothetical protein